MTEPIEARVLGIDPGLNITGYAVLETTSTGVKIREAGIVRSSPRKPIQVRLAEIHDGVRDVIESCQPSAMSLEELFSHYKRPRTAILMGHARGVICLAAAEAEIPIFHYEATKIKKILTGSGRASKEQVQQAIVREFSLAQAPEPHDVADALAIALCHLHFREKAVIT